MLDQDPAVAVDDRLGQPRGAGREQHVHGMGERHRLELERPRLRHERLPRQRVRQLALTVGQVHHVLERAQLLAHRRHLFEPVHRLAAVHVAGDREQHLRLDLAEARHHAAGAELRRAARPHRAEAGGGEHGGERLRDVGHVGHHAVASLHAEPHQPRAHARDQLAQLAEGQLAPPARLRVTDESHAVEVLVEPDHVLGVVERRAREPFRAWHRTRAEHPLGRRVRADLEEVPDRAPEALEVLDRPVPELLVVREVVPALVAQEVHVAAEPGGCACVRRRRPQHIALSRRPHYQEG